jgi:hypothetical protein
MRIRMSASQRQERSCGLYWGGALPAWLLGDDGVGGDAGGASPGAGRDDARVGRGRLQARPRTTAELADRRPADDRQLQPALVSEAVELVAGFASVRTHLKRDLPTARGGVRLINNQNFGTHAIFAGSLGYHLQGSHSLWLRAGQSYHSPTPCPGRSASI